MEAAKSTQRFMLRILRAIGAGAIARFMARACRKLAYGAHGLQYLIEWGARPVPPWFDHNIDLYYQWHKSRNPLSWERGIFSLIAIKPGARVLELCCGSGFTSYYFYSIRARQVTAIDLDRSAIAFAKSNYRTPNVTYVAGDIRHQIPEEQFDNIVIDASLEYFTSEEIESLMQSIKRRLGADGILSGYSIAQQVLQPEWKLIFRDKSDLLAFLLPYFRNVFVFETEYPGRHNLYFYASDAAIPFQGQPTPPRDVALRLPGAT